MARTAGSTSSTERSPGARSASDRLVALGYVVGAHGMRGALRVKLEAAGIEAVAQLSELWLGESEADETALARALVRAEPGRKGEIRLQLAGLTDRGEAEALRGRRLLARAAELEDLAPDELHDHQLVGCRVEDDRIYNAVLTQKELKGLTENTLDVEAAGKLATAWSAIKIR